MLFWYDCSHKCILSFRFFANRRKIWSDGVHNDSVEIWEKVRAKAKTGDTQLQKDLAEYKKRKQAKQTEDELLVDVAPTS